jgi:phospholipase C
MIKIFYHECSCKYVSNHLFQLTLNKNLIKLLDFVVTLPEAKKLRQSGAKEEVEISDFQKEMVQLAAVLNGDYTKDIYPDKLVEGMTVAEAAQYVIDAYNVFREECEKCIKAGMDGSHIPILEKKKRDDQPSKSRVWKIFACLGCGHGVDGN